MTNFFFGLLTFLISCSICTSQTAERNNSLLYKVEKTGTPFISYLFGTNHLLSSELIDTSLIISRILDSVGMIVVESSSELDTALLIQKMKMGPKDYYGFDSPEQETNVRKFIEEKISPFIFSPSIKPMVYIILMGALNTGYITDEGEILENLDDYFKRKGNQMNKKFDYFETSEFQLALLLDSISIKDQCKILISYAEYDEQANHSNNSIDSCYLSFDLDCLYENSFFDYFEYGEMLLRKRNLNWMEKLAGIINGEPALIAVGALHLPGESGLINLLRKMDYTVSPVALK